MGRGWVRARPQQGRCRLPLLRWLLGCWLLAMARELQRRWPEKVKGMPLRRRACLLLLLWHRRRCRCCLPCQPPRPL